MSETARPVAVLGVGGGIAAYKAVDVCRRLVDAGVHVAPVMTEAAGRFVGRTTFDALASEPVQVGLWGERSPIPHTRLGQRADVIVVAPATADLIARYAHGMADDLLTATLIATRAPVVICPAMHTEMWEHPAVQANVATLESRGVVVVSPEEGRLAGGDLGAGRLAEPSVIVDAVLGVLAGAAAAGPGRLRPASGPAPASGSSDLVGLRVLVTAGGTREPIDPVRVITNRSSGKQGHALAEAAYRRGAAVTLVTTTDRTVTDGIDVERVETAAEMERVVLRRAETADVVIMAAAVADFRPTAPAARKLKKASGVPEIVLEPTPDILAALGASRRPGQVLVGFAAETDDVRERAAAKLASKGVDLMVANDVSVPGVGFDHDTNEVVLLDASGDVTRVDLTTKSAVADAVLDRVAMIATRRAAGTAASVGGRDR
ncbi:MAG: bifunctional phosphopantothenoylcysteine decarboxylase/phosphopantothenate synthase [Actinomycetota bacterium]|jgi:phosphopantothenoylcysteine decarboxylase/phosphopantothenate--cysteine ligase|nr:bifunctional phosphopantothenoylcysteine decarboxylase/phosphopantothenate synthase [Actinomycetota bacterium]